MTCEQYRAALHQSLDQRAGEDLPPDFRAHAGGCEDCAKYTNAILRIDRGLASIQRAPLPAGLIESLLELPHTHTRTRPELSWRPFIVRGFAYFIASLTIWEFASLAPPSIQAVAALTLPCIGMAIFLLSALRQGMLGEY